MYSLEMPPPSGRPLPPQPAVVTQHHSHDAFPPRPQLRARAPFPSGAGARGAAPAAGPVASPSAREKGVLSCGCPAARLSRCRSAVRLVVAPRRSAWPVAELGVCPPRSAGTRLSAGGGGAKQIWGSGGRAGRLASSSCQDGGGRGGSDSGAAASQPAGPRHVGETRPRGPRGTGKGLRAPGSGGCG